MEITKLRGSLCCIPFLVLVTLVSSGSAQDSSCINKLSPCLNYLNGTKDPPDSCCDPLKSVIESDPKCLCSLVSNKGTRKAEQVGIDVNEAQALPGRCGQRVNPLSCLTNSRGSTNSNQNSAIKSMQVSFGVVMISAISAIAYI